MDEQGNGQTEAARPFVGFILDDAGYQVHLVNPTNVSYRRVVILTGAFCGDDDGVLETSKVVKELGALGPQSALLMEASDLDGLDFVIWFHVDLYRQEATAPAERVWFDLPKYGRRYAAALLPVLNVQGMRIALDARQGDGIEQEARTIHMEGRYVRTAPKATEGDAP